MTYISTTMPDSRPLNPDGNGVALVLMPFNDIFATTVAMGLLKAVLAGNNILCDEYYLNLEFASYAGVSDTMDIFKYCRYQMGEYVFAGEAFPGLTDDGEYPRIVRERLDCDPAHMKMALEKAMFMRNKVAPVFLDSIIEKYDWSKYEIIGFSSTYLQQTASLALAKKLRAKFPAVPIILGGFNNLGEMGIEWLNSVEYIFV